jgi:hypothetical protein
MTDNEGMSALRELTLDEIDAVGGGWFPKWVDYVVGVGGGIIIGAAVGGPIGAVVGGLAGAAVAK